MVGVCSLVTYSTLLLVCCTNSVIPRNWICAPKPQSRQFLFYRRGFFTLPTNFCLYLVKISLAVATVPKSKTPELVNTTTSKVNKQLRRSQILQT